MELRQVQWWRVLLPFTLFLTGACSGPSQGSVATADEEDPRLLAAREQVATGKVEEFEAHNWMLEAQRAFASDSDPYDYRGDYDKGMEWAEVAAGAAAKARYSPRVFKILTEQVRMCNHAARPEEAAATLKVLKSLKKLDPIRRNYVALLEYQGGLARLRFADHTYSMAHLQRDRKKLAREAARLEKAIDGLVAPEQADRDANEIWQRMQIVRASLSTGFLLNEALVAANAGRASPAQLLKAFEKRMQQRIWYVDAKRFPRAAALLSLRLHAFYRVCGHPQKAEEALATARRLYITAKDVGGLARVELAKADALLVPQGLVESMGVPLGTRPEKYSAFGPSEWPRLGDPREEDELLEATREATTLLVKAEAVYRDAQNQRGLAATFLRRGYLALLLGRFDDAAEAYRQSETVSALTGDHHGRLVALTHLLAAQVWADRVGKATRTVRELTGEAKKQGYLFFPEAAGRMLLGMAVRSLTGHSRSGPQAAALKLSRELYEPGVDSLLLSRHAYDVALSSCAIGLRYLCLQSIARVVRNLGYRDSGGPCPPAGKSRECHMTAGAALAAAEGLAPSIRFRSRALKYAEQAHKLIGPGDSRRNRAVAVLTRLYEDVGRFEQAATLIPETQLRRLSELAAASGRMGKAMELADKRVSRTNLALSDARELEESGDFTDPRALGRAERAHADSLLWKIELLLRRGAVKKRHAPDRVADEFTQAKTLLEEWKELMTGKVDWQKEPWDLLGYFARIAIGQDETAGAWMFLQGALRAVFDALESTPSTRLRARLHRRVNHVLQAAMEYLVAFSSQQVDLPGSGQVSAAAASLILGERIRDHEQEVLLSGSMPVLTEVFLTTQARFLMDAQRRARLAGAAVNRLESSTRKDFYEDSGVRQELVAALETLDKLERGLDDKHPSYAFARGATDPLVLADFEKLATDRQLAFLVYSIRSAEASAWLVDGEGTRVFKLPTQLREMEQLSGQLASWQGKGKGKGRGRTLRINEAVAQKLYERLIAPVATQLPVAKTVAIVPDGPLLGMPFGLLRTGDSTFQERNPYFVVQSLALFKALADRTASTPAGNKLLLVTSPAVGTGREKRPAGSLPDTGWLVMPGAGFGPVRASPLLSQQLQTLLTESPVKTLTGRNATEYVFKKLAGDYEVLHLGTHVFLDNDRPYCSGLQLVGAETTDDDGFLNAWEIAGRSLGAKLVVIEAGTTGMGWRGGAQGAQGLMRAFHTAGVPVVVASTLPVSADEAAPFLGAFYEALQGGLAVHRALQIAGDRMRTSGRAQSPAVGGFVAYGLGDQTL